MNETEVFDNPKTVEKGTLKARHIFLTQLLFTASAVAAYFLINLFFPAIATEINNYITLHLIY